MGVCNGGMIRGKTIILTVLSFTSESVMPYNRYSLESIITGYPSACAWRRDTATLQKDSRVPWSTRT